MSRAAMTTAAGDFGRIDKVNLHPEHTMAMLEPATFKSIMGSFPSGVTVVTVVDGEGKPRGLTCSAMCSVSLDPPMLLICVARSSATLAALRERSSFVVNILAEGAESVAHAAAAKGQDKFDGLNWIPSSRSAGAPILADYSTAYAECRTFEVIDAGDHVVILGVVEGGSVQSSSTPLVYMRGRVERIAPAETSLPPATVEQAGTARPRLSAARY